MIRKFKIEKESLVITILLFLLAMSVLIPYVFIGYASADDLQYFLNAHSGNLWELNLQFAKHQGRFHFLLTWPFGNSAYFLNIYITKILNSLFIISNILVVSLITANILKNRLIGYLIFLLSVVFLSGKGSSNPIVCYPLYFSGSFSIILLSVYFSVKYALTENKVYRSLSVLCFAFGILFYETFLLYFPLIFVIIYSLFPQNITLSFSSKLWANTKKCLPYFFVLLLYFSAYFSFRYMYPSHYEGASIASKFSLQNILNTILTFASGAYPLLLAFSNSWTTYLGAPYFLDDSYSNIFYILFSDHFDWILKSIIIGYLVYYLFQKIDNIAIKKIIIIFFIAFFYIYIPQIPLALTQKYLEYGGFQNYVTTYFAFIAVMVCVTLLFLFLYVSIKNEKIRNTYLVLVICIISISSVINDYSNYHTVKYLRKSKYVLTFMSKIAKTNDYKNIPDKSLIYVSQLYTNTPDLGFFFSQGFNWSTYFNIESNGKETRFSTSLTELIDEYKNTQTPPYYLTYGRNQDGIDQYLAMAKISPQSQIDTLNQTILTDSAVVYYYSNNKAFYLTFRTKATSDTVAFINNDTIPIINNVIELNVKNQVYKNSFMRLFIKTKSIDMNSIIISNNCTSNGKTLRLE